MHVVKVSELSLNPKLYDRSELLACYCNLYPCSQHHSPPVIMPYLCFGTECHAQAFSTLDVYLEDHGYESQVTWFLLFCYLYHLLPGICCDNAAKKGITISTSLPVPYFANKLPLREQCNLNKKCCTFRKNHAMKCFIIYTLFMKLIYK
jgi:hypothetical protein